MLVNFAAAVIFIPVVTYLEFGRLLLDCGTDGTNKFAFDAAGQISGVSHVRIVNGEKQFLITESFHVPHDLLDRVAAQ